jgi:serine/threonine protein kinase
MAFWRIQDKEPMKTLTGYIEVCHVLKRSFGDHCRQLGGQINRISKDFGSYSECDASDDIIFCLTGEKVAIKAHAWDITRRLQGVHAENPLNEIAAMQSLPAHPNVLTCTEVLFDGEYLHVIMPFCSRGDLHNRMEYHKKTNIPGGSRGLSEAESRFYFCQLLNGVKHLQMNGAYSSGSESVKQYTCFS